MLGTMLMSGVVFPLARFGSRGGPSPEAGFRGNGGLRAGKRAPSPAPFSSRTSQSPGVRV